MRHKAKRGNEKQIPKRARISEAKIREIVRYVAADLTALPAAALSGLNRNTVRLYRGVRERMLLACEAQRRLFGVVEVTRASSGRAGSRAGGGAAPTARPSSSASSSGRATSIPRSSRTAQSPPSRASSAAGRPAHRHQLRWLARLPRPGRPRLWHVRDDHARDEFIHINGIEASGAAKVRLTIQGPAETHLPPPSQGDRMCTDTNTPRYSTRK